MLRSLRALRQTEGAHPASVDTLLTRIVGFTRELDQELKKYTAQQMIDSIRNKPEIMPQQQPMISQRNQHQRRNRLLLFRFQTNYNSRKDKSQSPHDKSKRNKSVRIYEKEKEYAIDNEKWKRGRDLTRQSWMLNGQRNRAVVAVAVNKYKKIGQAKDNPQLNESMKMKTAQEMMDTTDREKLYLTPRLTNRNSQIDQREQNEKIESRNLENRKIDNDNQEILNRDKGTNSQILRIVANNYHEGFHPIRIHPPIEKQSEYQQAMELVKNKEIQANGRRNKINTQQCQRKS
ncbi:MAG: hypothetical protein EZS28_018521 [Streblomastix strix]|uniref:Uncharacterized protein n=1 Tax=Streblomastix strix TaxID=222440 RepID=A0A5J4VUV6_9EUKA|nr:MAG: hypothetical protein EZS28_018521 [Streblomastix strix]